MNPTSSTIGEGTRIFHFLIDTILIFILSYFMYKWYNFYAFYGYFTPYRYGYFFFVTTFLYTLFFELLFLQTPAKMLTGTKVVSLSGARPNLWQFLVRAIIRTTIISMFGLAWNDKPLHDTFSSTILMNKKA